MPMKLIRKKRCNFKGRNEHSYTTSNRIYKKGCESVMERKPMKVTIVGAGSTRTPALIGSIIKLKERFPVKKLVFYDIDMDRVEKMRVYMELMMKTHSPETELIFTGNKDEAYKDIDFVFCQMRVGGSEYRSYDEKIWNYRSRNLWSWRICIRDEINRGYDRNGK